MRRSPSFRSRSRSSIANESDSPGPSDGQRYKVKGHIVGPRDQLAKGSPRRVNAATLYLHGLSYGEFFWRFQADPDYDFAAKLARRGLVSVVIDRLGYGASGKPEGTEDSYGAQADVAHQIVQALRTGDYRLRGSGMGEADDPPRFERIVLAGHSASVFVAQIAAYSFGDIDGLIVMSLGDAGASPLAVTTFAETATVCQQGGEQSDGDRGPEGYAYFGQTDEQFQAAHFFDPKRSVLRAATKLRTRDPCGETAR